MGLRELFRQGGNVAFSLDGRDKFCRFQKRVSAPSIRVAYIGLLACFCVTGCIEDKRTLVDSDRQMVDDAAGSATNADMGRSPAMSDAQSIDAGVMPTDAGVLADATRLSRDTGTRLDARSTPVSDAGQSPREPVDCIQACDTVVTCLSGQCTDSLLGSFTQCVRACEAGEVDLTEVARADCFEVENWACEGPFSNVCNCRDNRCQRACERTIDCLEPVCEQPILQPDDCVFLCEEQPQSFPADFILGAACESVQAAYCPNLFQVCGGCPQPDPNEFNVGAACERSADCVSGSLIAYCIPANVPETGEETGWVDGYCIGLECNPGDCGPSARCVALTEDQQTGCLARCGDNQAPCRAGYQCTAFDPDDPDSSLCVPL